MNPMRRVSGVPATIVASKSRPCRSVPKGYAQEGGLRMGAESARDLLVSTKICPSPTNSTSAESSAMPTTSEVLRPM